MKFINKTNRFWNFEIDNCEPFNIEGVASDGMGLLKFPTDHGYNEGKNVFMNQEDCEKWFAQYKDSQVEKIIKVQNISSTKALEPTDQDWDEMKKHIPGAKRGSKTK